MLSGNEFIILSRTEVSSLYEALKALCIDKSTYSELRSLGIFNIVQYMESFLFKDEDENE